MIPMLPLPRARGRWWVVLAAFGLCTLASVLAVARVIPGQPAAAATSLARPELASLAAAVGADWPLAVRLTGFRGARPLATPANTASRTRRSFQLVAIAGQLRRTAERQPHPRHLGALGSARLLTNDIDEGVTLLEQATALAPNDPVLLCDMAGGYLLRAAANDRAEDLPRALALAERALRLSPRLKEAFFNRAIALERLSLRAQAVKAWEEYAVREDRTEWAREAHARRQTVLARLQVRPADRNRAELQSALQEHRYDLLPGIVSRAPQVARETFEEDLLSIWARHQLETPAASSADDDDAMAPLAAIAGALKSAARDQLAADTVDALRRVPPDRRPAAARALLEWDRGRRVYDDDQFERARELLAEAADQLRRLDIPFAHRVTFQHGLTLYYAQRMDEAARTFAAVIDAAGRASYFSLEGRAHWVRGLMRPMPADVDERLRDYRLAHQAFTRAGEPANAASVHVLLAETYQLLGDHGTAWDHRRQALEAIDVMSDPRRRHVMLLDAARASLLQGLPETALHFDSALLDFALAWNRAAPISEGYAERARVSAALNLGAEAEQDSRRAAEWFERIEDAGMRSRLEPALRATQAEVATLSGSGRAVPLIDLALQRQRQAGRGQYAAALWRLKARAWLGSDAPARVDLAESALREGIEELDLQRRLVRDDRLRRLYVDERWNLFREMIALQVHQRGQPDRALTYAERGRSRELLDRLGQATPLTPDAAVAALSPNTLVFYYVVTDERTFLWVLGRSVRVSHVLEITRAQLRLLVQAHRQAVIGDDAQARELLSSKLYDLLIEPGHNRLLPGMNVQIVPDDVLQTLPFDVLRASSNDQYFGLRHPISFAPSLSAGHVLALKGGARTSALHHALAVMSSASSQDFPALPDARAEVLAIARLYTESSVIDAATTAKGDIAQMFSSPEVIHLALHASPESRQMPPFLTLDVASRVPGEQILSGSEIERLTLRATVVVLAACSTARGPMSPGEGSLSLAFSFLMAGASTSVGSLWDVDDRATKEFMLRFHRLLARHGSVADALIHAKRELSESTDTILRKPQSWAGFALVGAGYAATSPGRTPTDR